MNITSEAGKTKGIKALKIMEDVVDIEIDIKTYYSQVGASLVEIIKEINNAGCDADAKKKLRLQAICKGAKKNKLYAKCL